MESDLSYFRSFGEQVEQRLNKLNYFTERGQLPYPPRIICNHNTAEAIQLFERAEAELPEGGEEKPLIAVAVAGRLVAVRKMGKSTFAHLEDGTGRLQLYLKKNELGDELYDQFIKQFDLGDFVAAQGNLFRTRRRNGTDSKM